MSVRKALSCVILSLVVFSSTILLPNTPLDKILEKSLFKEMRWRNIGPANFSGRIVDVEALDHDFRHVVVASASGGVWKSINAGTTWLPIFDNYGSASIGDIAVFQKDPNIIWVGTGEANNRNSVAWGDGIYKSTDGGQSFTNMGLRDTYQIARVIIDPNDANTVYVAAIGYLWGYIGERGLFKTTDGGRTWAKLTDGLPKDGKTGAIDLIMDPSNANTLYVAFYERLRKPYRFDSGGPNGGIFKTTDGVDHMPEAAVLELICRQKELNFLPGTNDLYSNSCYFLLAEIVKRASGRSLRDFADENIFQPLAMNDSHFHDNNRHIIRNRALGYSKIEDGEFGNMIMRFDLVGSGGLYTTVADLFLWDQNFYDNTLGEARPELITQMLSNGNLDNGEEVDYAFALRRGFHRGARTVSHAGSLAGYRAQLMRFPQHRFSVVILSNLAGFDPTARALEVADIYLAPHLQPKELTELSSETMMTGTRSTPTVSNKPLSDFVGDYYSPELEVFYRISHDEDRLFVSVNGNPKSPLESLGEDTFSGPFKLSFQRDSDEHVHGFTVDAGRVTNLRFSKKSGGGT